LKNVSFLPYSFPSRNIPKKASFAPKNRDRHGSAGVCFGSIGGKQMTIAEILNRLPNSEAELLEATTPQIPHDPCRRRVFEARELLEKLYHDTGRLDVLDVADLLPSDPCHFEQVIASGEGQEVIRGNILRARELLKFLEVKE
jgi:hypothetical protein